MNPLITCLCLTRSRREWLPKAIACFQAQTHEPRELLIVADQPSDVEGLVPDAPNIHVLYAPGVVGTKRNIGSDAAAGEFIAVWDDDDWSEPGRLADQVARLLETGKSVTGYYSMKFTDGVKWWQYTGWPNMALGTSLDYR